MSDSETLQGQIDRMRSEIKTDGYDISIGEWMSIYEGNELDIHPEFQRFFRWDSYQKTALIESILLGIPVPLIFVAQRPDGVWDVIDGLQRLSTVFQFAGILRNENGDLVDRLILNETTYLPKLKGMKWEDDADPSHSFTAAQRLQIKRSKLGVSIVLSDSTQRTKYDLFQRLNRGGSPLSDQEVRTCILVLENPELYRWLKSISTDENFRATVALTDKALEEQYDLELVLRFLTLRRIKDEELKRVGDISAFLTEKMIEIARMESFDKEGEEHAFRETFLILANSLGSDAFRKFEVVRSKFVGGFLISAFEAVAIGIGRMPDEWSQKDGEIIKKKVKELWQSSTFRDAIGGGVRASQRIPKIVPLGRELFSQ